MPQFAASQCSACNGKPLSWVLSIVSHTAQKALWVVGELDLPYRQIDASGRAGGIDMPDFLAMNPDGRIPLLVDGDLKDWESNSIVRLKRLL